MKIISLGMGVQLERIEFADQQELFMCEEGFCGL